MLPEACRALHVATRNTLPTMGAHVYTVNGALNVSLAWCPDRFLATEIEVCWQTWLAIMESVQ